MKTLWRNNIGIGLLAALLLAGCQSSDPDVQKTEPETNPPTPDPVVDDSIDLASAFRPAAESCETCPTLPAYVPSAHTTTTTVHVSSQGAVGDGGYEHTEIQQAIDAAGIGGRVLFESGRTYSICKMLIAKADQHWLSTGATPATIKRCTSPVTTLTADVVAGATSVPVASLSGFEIGMSISPVETGGDDLHAGEFNNHVVYNTVGNVLHFHNTIEKDYKAGDKVVVSFAMVRDNNNVLFEGLEFDGNASGNDHFLSWARHASLWLTSNGSRVNHSRFTHSQGDAISVQGLDNVIEHNVFTDLNGSALHLSAARQTIVRTNQMERTNLKADRVVHAEAAITWSLGNQDILVENNCIRDIPAAAFGHILVHGNNSGADIRDNQICETESLMKVVLNPMTDGSEPDIDLLFTGNRATNTGTMKLIGANTHLGGIEVSGNRIHNGAIYAKNTDDMLISDNHISLTDDASLNDEIESSNNKYAALSVLGGRNVQVDGNFISGGRKGIQVYNSLDLSTDVTVTGNTVTQQYENNILIGHLSSIDSDTTEYSDFGGVTLADNLVISDRLDAGRAAVELGRRAELTGHCIESNQAGARLHGYTSDQGTETVVSGNRVTAWGESLTARAPYTHGYALTDNTASPEITAALLASNPNSERAGALTDECHLQNVPVPKD